jgi:hypothetical protein
MYKVPENVVNKKLYMSIKKDIHDRLRSQGRRWSAYASGELVRTYKSKGGKYRGKKSPDGIARWFKEEWVDVCALPKKKPCGREEYSKKKFPYCRPLKRVDKDTPITVAELTKTQLKQRCRQKNSLK